jgi:hypothetical protein
MKDYVFCFLWDGGDELVDWLVNFIQVYSWRKNKLTNNTLTGLIGGTGVGLCVKVWIVTRNRGYNRWGSTCFPLNRPPITTSN